MKMIVFGFLFWTVAFIPYFTFSYISMGLEVRPPDEDFQNFSEKIGSSNKEVIVSDWLTIAREDWSKTNPSRLNHVIRVPQLLEESYAQGAVLVYLRSAFSKPLPSITSQGLEMKHGTAVDMLWVEGAFQNHEQVETLENLDFRYVLVPSEKMEINGLSERQIKELTYEELQTAFNLESELEKRGIAVAGDFQ